MPATPPSTPELARLVDRLATMPDMARLVFQRHRFDEEPLSSIALDLGIEVRSVERLLADAMFHLDGP